MGRVVFERPEKSAVNCENTTVVEVPELDVDAAPGFAHHVSGPDQPIEDRHCIADDRDHDGEHDPRRRKGHLASSIRTGQCLLRRLGPAKIEALYGSNDHHIAEACFKGLARALRAAFAIDPRAAGEVPSTKGTLGG